VSVSALYKSVLMEHYRRPHNFGALEHADAVARGSNPMCGDDVEVAVRFQADRLAWVQFRGRGCSVCIASASLMTDAVQGLERSGARQLVDTMRAWFTAGDGGAVPDPPAALEALAAVRGFPARRRCVLLAWEALEEALSDPG